MERTTIYFVGNMDNRELFETEAQSWIEVNSNVNIVNAFKLAECMGEGSLDKSKFFAVRLTALDMADIVYVLDGWETSEDAVQEHDFAVRNNKAIFYQSGMSLPTGKAPIAYIDKTICLAIVWQYLSELAVNNPGINVAEAVREITCRMNDVKAFTIMEE